MGGGRGVEAFRQLWGKEGGLSRLTSHVSRFTWFLFFLLLPTHAFSDDQAVADLIAARDFRSALTRLDSLLSLKDLPVPARGRAILQRALCHKALAQPADALAGFEASHDAFPELKDYLLLWEGECLEALDQPDRASARYAALVKQAPKSPFRDDARLRIARLTDRAGRHEEAARLYRQVAGAAPGADDVAEALSGLASAQASLKQTVEARETCRTLIRNHPGSRWALKALQPFGAPRTAADRYDRGQVYFHHGQWADAIASFRSLIARHPSDTRVGMARYFEARAHFAAKDYASAASGFTTAYRRHRVRAALFYLGRCAVRADDDRRGADLLLEFATKYPAHESADDALWYAAWSLERLGDHAKARQTYLRSPPATPRAATSSSLSSGPASPSPPPEGSPRPPGRSPPSARHHRATCATRPISGPASVTKNWGTWPPRNAATARPPGPTPPPTTRPAPRWPSPLRSERPSCARSCSPPTARALLTVPFRPSPPPRYAAYSRYSGIRQSVHLE
ncbi:MAG: hypothetical protein A3F84_20555 [Candidatus Handelsmanbacteria bacterium RIFCSPLOWO2_12_FULL_64_10]|uniref:Uncharacterized protein n=1 Tax=Handelsmanbacteria sp. (strain RIFCSPLOWO2_12_FULL_64_10) TaxID=1817868 RepID=A0A1F6C9S7_HANXR|nr:MAG: hypothetical protein A3F84_20555 [Candidatus Handelsmanbacteria bacterium RIFCSPLOWO2_12_FULL_64_10]